MEEQSGSAAAVAVAAPQDAALRLQALVVGWRGVERGQPLATLHQECQQAAGPGGRVLLPQQVRLVRDLDTAALKAALQRLRGSSQSAELRFRVAPVGRFDAALAPVGLAGEAPERWLLALEEALPLREQVALYAHALTDYQPLGNLGIAQTFRDQAQHLALAFAQRRGEPGRLPGCAFEFLHQPCCHMWMQCGLTSGGFAHRLGQFL